MLIEIKIKLVLRLVFLIFVITNKNKLMKIKSTKRNITATDCAFIVKIKSKNDHTK
jgi:hypothetical protein